MKSKESQFSSNKLMDAIENTQLRRETYLNEEDLNLQLEMEEYAESKLK
jgi:hypothetical protein